MTIGKSDKVTWSGRLVAVQPRIRLNRSFDERSHNYLGYNLRLDGTCGDVTSEFLIAVGKVAHEKHQFCAGMEVSGLSVPVNDPRLENAAYYKTSRITLTETANVEVSLKSPPFLKVPPDLWTYRERGHRRLAARTYELKCTTCIWGCRMPVELVIDNWKPWIKRYRSETFCYGPKSCPLYRAGAIRKVPGRGGVSFQEEDWIDEEVTRHRADDD
ncbi:MAG: hypothetical protein OEV49_15300 [candidate division Zixibacteria bacterium]|nr:hypothetical protein [candidate division Zixibacteria bacterium]MDH3936464.1 hypothetical protein [candidate division Zixibacteria bacterium]MDH4033109.1 hypothetical protein [candidate division Zixibacteria bacterium]